jgi:hypothetical protein
MEKIISIKDLEYIKKIITELKINTSKLNNPVKKNYPPSTYNDTIISEFISVTSNGV